MFDDDDDDDDVFGKSTASSQTFHELFYTASVLRLSYLILRSLANSFASF